jgi:hypothetical protein
MTSLKKTCQVRTNSASEKISRIKRTFTSLIGEQAANNYVIHGKNAEVRIISLPREKVIWANNLYWIK